MAGATPIPQDMRDLLIRLDQQVKDGFLNVNQKLDEMNRRADGHETRIRSLEDWRSGLKGSATGLSVGWKVVSGAVVAVVAVVGFMIGKATDAPKAPIQAVTVAAPANPG